MAGFVLGLKRSVRDFHNFSYVPLIMAYCRGFVGRILTTTTGLLTMAAFCYPHETVDIVRTGIAHTQQKWHEFQQCKFHIATAYFSFLSAVC